MGVFAVHDSQAFSQSLLTSYHSSHGLRGPVRTFLPKTFGSFMPPVFPDPSSHKAFNCSVTSNVLWHLGKPKDVLLFFPIRFGVWECGRNRKGQGGILMASSPGQMGRNQFTLQPAPGAKQISTAYSQELFLTSSSPSSYRFWQVLQASAHPLRSQAYRGLLGLSIIDALVAGSEHRASYTMQCCKHVKIGATLRGRRCAYPDSPIFASHKSS